MASETCSQCRLEFETQALRETSRVCRRCTEADETFGHATQSFVGATGVFENAQTQSAPSSLVPPPPTTPDIAGYENIEYLASGGMGNVFKALERSTSRVVAIKMLHPRRMTEDLIERFSVEAKSLACLRHENIVLLHEFNDNSFAPYLVMEYVDGIVVSKLRSATVTLPPRQAANIIRQAALGAQCAHELGVIHRDIKPNNLILDKTGVVKLSDFGLAKRLGHDDSLTIHGSPAGGTPGYMAPEQLDPQLGDCLAPTDVWGLGASLYELLCGVTPYPCNRNLALAVLNTQHSELQKQNPKLPRALCAIVEKCLKKSQQERYSTAVALADDLERFLKGQPTIARPLSLFGRAWHFGRNLGSAAVTAWLMALLVIAIVGFSFFRQAPVKPPGDGPAKSPTGFAAQREALQRGETVTLIGDEGNPGEVEWPFTTGAFGRPWGSDGATAIESVSYNLAILLDDPGIDDYTIHAELKHLKSKFDKSDSNAFMQCGLAYGFQVCHSESAENAFAFTTFTFQDFDAKAVNGEPALGQTEAAVTTCVLAHNLKTQLIPFQSIDQIGRLQFVPNPSLPGAWRTLEVMIGKDAIVQRFLMPNGHWKNIAYAPPGSTVQAQYDDRVRMQLLRGESFKNEKYASPGWNPRSGLGLWVSNAAFAVRNYRIIPKTP